MGGKRSGYRVLLVVTLVFTVAGLATAIPNPGAGTECALGYRALCAFTPTSTFMLLMVAALACVIRKREFAGDRRSQKSTGSGRARTANGW